MPPAGSRATPNPSRRRPAGRPHPDRGSRRQGNLLAAALGLAVLTGVGYVVAPPGSTGGRAHSEAARRQSDREAREAAERSVRLSEAMDERRREETARQVRAEERREADRARFVAAEADR